MNKKSIICGFCLLLLFSCNRYDQNNDQEKSDSQNGDSEESCFSLTDLDGAGGSCNYIKSSKCQVSVACSFESSKYKTGETFTVEKLEFSTYQEKDAVSLKGKCAVGCSEDDWCGAGFVGFDKALFKQSLVGKEIVLWYIEGYYGDIYREEAGRDLRVLRHKDGTLIAVGGTGIVNEDGEHEWDIKVWPSELVPEVKVEQKILPSCESFCVEYMAGPDGEKESLYYDNLIAPPLEITVTGKKPVVVKNGEVVASEGYEYFVRDSLRATEEDSDGFVFVSGKKYKFDFFIVNTEALK